MEHFKAYVSKHRTISYILGISFLVFINCCGFPILNLNKKWPLMITATQIYVVSAGALLSGAILAGLFPKRKFAVVAAVDFAAITIGLACRYLLELGEVSNTYNFTLPNTLLHIGIFLAISMLVWLTSEMKRIANANRSDNA